MARVLLLTTEKLKKNTPIQDNVEDNLLKPYIFKAAETHIHQYLGTNLYNRITGDVAAGTISGVYKALLDDFIQPCLIEWSFYEAMPFISLKITNKSINRGNADYLVEGDLADLKYLRQTVRDLAEFYGERLIGYLKENNELFPEYNTNSGLDKIVPNSNAYFNGVYLGNGRSRNCSWGLGENYKDLF
jgi:hypothetical protein